MKALHIAFSVLIISGAVSCAQNKSDDAGSPAPAQPAAVTECDQVVEFTADQIAKCKSLGLPDRLVGACNRIPDLDGAGKLHCLGNLRATGASEPLATLCTDASYAKDANNKTVWSADAFNQCVSEASRRDPAVVNGCISRMSTNALKMACIGAASTTYSEDQLKACSTSLSFCTRWEYHDEYPSSNSYSECLNSHYIQPTDTQIVQCVSTGKWVSTVDACRKDVGDGQYASGRRSDYSPSDSSDDQYRDSLAKCIANKN